MPNTQKGKEIARINVVLQTAGSRTSKAIASSATLKFGSRGIYAAIADCKSAIQQTTSLRYAREGKEIEITAAQQ